VAEGRGHANLLSLAMRGVPLYHQVLLPHSEGAQLQVQQHQLRQQQQQQQQLQLPRHPHVGHELVRFLGLQLLVLAPAAKQEAGVPLCEKLGLVAAPRRHRCHQSGLRVAARRWVECLRWVVQHWVECLHCGVHRISVLASRCVPLAREAARGPRYEGLVVLEDHQGGSDHHESMRLAGESQVARVAQKLAEECQTSIVLAATRRLRAAHCNADTGRVPMRGEEECLHGMLLPHRSCHVQRVLVEGTVHVQVALRLAGIETPLGTCRSHLGDDVGKEFSDGEERSRRRKELRVDT